MIHSTSNANFFLKQIKQTREKLSNNLKNWQRRLDRIETRTRDLWITVSVLWMSVYLGLSTCLGLYCGLGHSFRAELSTYLFVLGYLIVYLFVLGYLSVQSYLFV